MVGPWLIFRGRRCVGCRGNDRWWRVVERVWVALADVVSGGQGRSSGPDVLSDAGGVIRGERGGFWLGCSYRRVVGVCGVEGWVCIYLVFLFGGAGA